MKFSNIDELLDNKQHVHVHRLNAEERRLNSSIHIFFSLGHRTILYKRKGGIPTHNPLLQHS